MYCTACKVVLYCMQGCLLRFKYSGFAPMYGACRLQINGQLKYYYAVNVYWRKLNCEYAVKKDFLCLSAVKAEEIYTPLSPTSCKSGENLYPPLTNLANKQLRHMRTLSVQSYKDDFFRTLERIQNS